MALIQLAPYVAGRDGPWNRRTAAHLLRRAGFGASKAEIDSALAKGLTASVASLFAPSAAEEARFQRTFDGLVGLMDLANASDLQVWWCYRLLRTEFPLREKATLFWHGHFATSYYKVGDMHLLHRQNETLRRLALGDVRSLVQAIARDPAMLVYLDSESNTKEHPNENFARELMELFTCGIGHYTEEDVREAARAFTGWQRDGSEFLFNADAHDDGRKRVLGRVGRLHGTEVIDILVVHQATARFIARKLLRFFASPAPDEAVVDEAAGVFASSGLDVRTLLQTLFSSKYFYSAACMGRRIASPTEFVIGTLRTLGCSLPATRVNGHLVASGQELFAPPSVKGWDGEEKWINSSTWAARIAFAREIAELRGYGKFDANLPLADLVPADETNPSRVIEALVQALGQGDLPAATAGRLAEVLRQAPEGQDPQLWDNDADFRSGQTRRALAALLSLPDSHRS